jgi:hypothetical protein
MKAHRSRRAGLRKRLIVVVVGASLVAAALLAQAGNAAVAVQTTGVPGPVYENALPVACVQYGSPAMLQVNEHGPDVRAATLPNGSTGQWVNYYDVVYDTSTGAVINSPWQGWTWATTSNWVQLSTIPTQIGLNDSAIVAVHLLWYDPRSGTYSGSMSYGVNLYEHVDYDNPLVWYTHC